MRVGVGGLSCLSRPGSSLEDAERGYRNDQQAKPSLSESEDDGARCGPKCEESLGHDQAADRDGAGDGCGFDEGGGAREAECSEIPDPHRLGLSGRPWSPRT